MDHLDGAAISFDSLRVASFGVEFTYTLRSASSCILDTFTTELHTRVHERPLTHSEEETLLAFGVFHATYVYLPFATKVKLLQIRAGEMGCC